MSKFKSDIKRYIINLGILIIFDGIPFISYANPQLENIAAGNIRIEQQANVMTINQSSQQGIINWNSFNIAQHESVNFQQPSGGSTLNRINANQGASEIYGKLTATGQIILVNPAGIFFGADSVVNVGGLIASTASLSNQDYLNHFYHFTDAPINSSVINQGKIIAAQNGLIALIGNNIRNDGLIQTNLGQVVLGSGKSFTLNFSGDNLIHFSVDERAINVGGITNTGALLADGGKILISAKTAANVLDRVINISGVMQARSVSKQNGEIILSSDRGVVHVNGKIDASGRDKAQQGGKVTITGYNILLDGSFIDVSGDVGGGEINIGGSMQGIGPLPNSNAVVLMPNSILLADAITNGNGGNIILWSDYVTKAYGKISARGGNEGGNGGFIETSSKYYLDTSGLSVDTRAPFGTTGMWLLDPTDVTVSASATSNETFASNIYTPNNVATANILFSELQDNLNLSNVTILTTSSGAGNGDIAIEVPLTWSSPYTLTLNAVRNIYLNADITAMAGGLTLIATNGAQTLLGGTIGSGVIGGAVGAVTANINVANFLLQAGQWYQNIAGALPQFNVLNNFSINTGSAYNSSFNAQFTRIDSSSGNGITDIFGLQGVATGPLSTNYVLKNNIDATITNYWNNGGQTGFAPIGAASFYSGNFNGQGFSIQNIYINRPGDLNVGLIANLNAGASVSNLSVSGTVIGNIDVGGIVGTSIGTISNVYSSVTVSGFQEVGGIVGLLSAGSTLDNSYATGSVSATNFAGGLVGRFGGGTSITNSYATGPVSASFGKGGLVGFQQAGSVTASFWDTDTTTASAGVGFTTGGTFSGTGGCFTGTCTNGGTANLSDQTTYTGAGWSFGVSPASATWFSISGNTRPILQMEYNTNISNPHQLQLMALNLSGAYTLNNDIDFSSVMNNKSEIWGTQSSINSGAGFYPIGTTFFNGSLNGQGYTIQNLYINRSGDLNVGLIANLNAGASVSNLNVSGTVIGNIDVGAIVGTSIGTISNVYSSATVSGFQEVGGVVGAILGGGTLADSYATGSVSASNFAGGLVGRFGGGISITNSYATGPVSASFGKGGLIGIQQAGSVTSSFWDTDTTTASAGVGFTTGGTFSGTGGCFTGTCTNGGTANLSSLATYSGAGWSITSTPSTSSTKPAGNWFIYDGATRPMLLSENVTSISTPHALQMMGATLGANYTLASDIDFTSAMTNSADVWGTNISTSTGSGFMRMGSPAMPFSGDLNGNYHIISNLYENRTTGRAALFDEIVNAFIGNLFLNNVNIAGIDAMAPLVVNTLGNTVITNVHATGLVTANASGSWMGGLITNLEGYLSNSSSRVNVVSSTNPTVMGSLVAFNNVPGVIINSYGTGLVQGPGVTGSGIGGINQGLIVNSYWDTETSGQSSSSGGTGATTAQMMTQSTFNGWDFTNLWGILPSQSYPYPKWLYPSTPRVISSTSQAVGNVLTQLVANGTNISTAYTGANGFIYNIVKNGIISDSSALLIYFNTNGGAQSNVVAFAPSAGASLTNLSMTANTLTLGSGLSSSMTVSTLSTAKGSQSDSDILFSVSGSDLTLSPNISLVTTPTTTFSNTGNVTTTGTGNITINGSLALTTSTILSANDILISGNVTGTGATSLTINNTGSSSLISGNIDNTITSLIKSGSGTLTLSGANTYGTTTINAGTLRAGATNVFSSTSSISLANVASAILDLNGFATTIGSLSGGGTTGGNVTLGTATLTTGGNNTSTTYSGVISGTGGLTKEGTGTFTLANNNTYSGATTVNAGTLRAGVANAFSSLSNVSLANAVGVVLDLNGFATTIGSLSGGGATGGNVTLGAGTLTVGNATNTTYSGVISGTGGLTKQGTGIFTLAGNNTYSGATNINAGTLAYGVSNALNDTTAVTVALNATYNLAGFSDTIGAFAGAGNTNLDAGTLTMGTATSTSYSGVISGIGGSIVKNGTGTLTLSGINTYSGNTILNAGTLLISNNAALGASTLIYNGGTFSTSVNNLTLASDLTLNSTLTYNSSNDLTLSGDISGTGGLTKSGSSILSLLGINAYTGVTTLNGGSIIVTDDSGLGLPGSGTVVSSGTLNVSSMITAEPITLSGGSLANDGTSIFSGPISLTANSVITSNAGSQLTLNGGINGAVNLTLDGAGSFNVTSIGGTTPINNLIVNSPLTLSGNITSAGTQSYNNLLTLATAVTLSGTSISFANGITGNQNLFLQSTNMNLSGSLTLNDLTITGTGLNNLLSIITNNEEDWTLTGINAGNIATIGIAGTGSFTNIQNLQGGNDNDSFTLSGGTLTGSLDGGTGINTLTADNGVNNWTITGTNAGSVTGVTGGFSNIQNLVGNSNNDNFILMGGTVTGSIAGNGGTNTLAANNVANTWNITGANMGNVTGVAGGFTAIQNLTGGTAGNEFVFADGASISGMIQGTNLGSINRLNYTNYTTPVNITLTTTNSGQSVNGTSTITTFDNITHLIAQSSIDNFLTPPVGKQNLVVITDALTRSGFINDPIFFTGFLIPSTSSPNTPSPGFNSFVSTVIIPNINVMTPQLASNLDYTYQAVDGFYDLYMSARRFSFTCPGFSE